MRLGGGRGPQDEPETGPQVPGSEELQDEALVDLRNRVTTLQERRAKLLQALEALEDRVTTYEANHPNV